MNEAQRRASYLAGIFDSGLSVNVSGNGKTGWRARISKTSANPDMPVTLWKMVGEKGGLFSTARGTRWCLESQGEIREFLQFIEPYVEIRKGEIEKLLELCLSLPGDDSEALVKELKDLRHKEG